MKTTIKQLRRIIRETLAGKRAARASMMRNIHTQQGEDMDFIDELQDLYPDIDEYFDGGWDDEDREWIVMDEVEGRHVPSGVKTPGPIGKLKAYHSVNSREAINYKAAAKANQMMEMLKRRIR